ncbi:MAG: flippase-like domain-containing protein [Acidobacteria bacterium]|nr:flippase-like domain-containing protein [Acidobacteriota bacterium]MCW5948470.1 flippase-like domain-containing protein [Pyrinomonadaceae bacterium]
MDQHISREDPATAKPGINARHIGRLKAASILLTAAGIGLFVYFIYTTGVDELIDGIVRFGWTGFAVVAGLFFLRILVRAGAWNLSVYEPYRLGYRDTVPAVIIGEAMSSLIPLGILISGTAKAVAVRQRVPLVSGLSSVATENLFYSLVTSIFLILGAVIFARGFELDPGWVWAIDVIIVGIVAVVVFLVVMVIRQWHFASELCEKLYRRGIARGWLENGRLDVRLFENMIYGFYRRYPRRFLPICGFEAAYHIIGIAEVWYVLYRLGDAFPSLLNSFLLESVSRLVTIMFKLIPFVIGVDEAGAQFVGDTVGLAAGVAVTLALIRKGRILFWTAIGILFIVKRGLRLPSLAGRAEA